MPLTPGTSDKTVRDNALEMISKGWDRKRAWAAAYRNAGKGRAGKKNPKKKERTPLVVSYARAIGRLSRYAAVTDFHAGLHKHLGEHTAHLAYADMLEEEGKPAHAEVVRGHIGHGHTERGSAEPYYEHRPDDEGTTEFDGQPIEPGQFRVHIHALASMHHHPDLVTLEQRSNTDPDTIFTWRNDYPAGQGREIVRRLIEEGAVPKRATTVRYSRAAAIAAEVRKISGRPRVPKKVVLAVQKMAAYRAPAGGVVVRGTFYRGGMLIPDMRGGFAAGPKT